MMRARLIAWASLLTVWSMTAASSVSAQAPKVVGDWEGNLKIPSGIELRLVIHVIEKGKALTSTMDSPDQGSNGLKVDETVFKDGDLTLTLKQINGSFAGKIDEKGETIAGKWSQNGETWPLTLNRVDPAKAKAMAIPKEFEGLWEGKLAAGAGIELRVVLQVTKDKDGALKAVFRSPDQIDTDFVASAVTLKGKAASFAVKLIAGSFSGTLNDAKTELTGKWKQGAAIIPLTFKKVEKETPVKRPQTPQPPFPYESENVSYQNPDAKNKLVGTLTKPKGAGPFPVVLLITGSGQQDRDETLFKHKPFLVLADALTRRGVAVLRVDDRGVGGSTGSAAKATSADFAHDVHAGIVYLKTRKDIDPKRIGLMGHSEGGLIAPMVAADHPDEVAFIVLLAGPGLDGSAIIKMQSTLILKAMDVKEDMIKAQETLIDELIMIAKSETDDTQAAKKLKAAAKKVVDAMPKEAREAAGDDASSAAQPRVAMFASPWFRFFLSFDPAPTLAKVKCPVLAVNGEKDLQVPPKEDLEAIAKALKQGGNTRFVTKELPGLNHLFQTSKTGSPAEYGAIEETFAPSALKLIGDWIVETAGVH